MIILLTVLLIVLSIIIILLITGLFIKKGYSLEQRINISKPSQDVFDFVRYLKNLDQYNQWLRVDPQLKKEFKGTDGVIGSIISWDSPNAKGGKGEQEIINLEAGKSVDYEIRFKKPFEGIAKSYIITEKFDGGTIVRWGFAGKNKYPMNVPFALFGMRKVLEKDLCVSLERLRDILEK